MIRDKTRRKQRKGIHWGAVALVSGLGLVAVVLITSTHQAVKVVPTPQPAPAANISIVRPRPEIERQVFQVGVLPPVRMQLQLMETPPPEPQQVPNQVVVETQVRNLLEHTRVAALTGETAQAVAFAQGLRESDPGRASAIAGEILMTMRQIRLEWPEPRPLGMIFPLGEVVYTLDPSLSPQNAAELEAANQALAEMKAQADAIATARAMATAEAQRQIQATAQAEKNMIATAQAMATIQAQTEPQATAQAQPVPEPEVLPQPEAASETQPEVISWEKTTEGLADPAEEKWLAAPVASGGQYFVGWFKYDFWQYISNELRVWGNLRKEAADESYDVLAVGSVVDTLPAIGINPDDVPAFLRVLQWATVRGTTTKKVVPIPIFVQLGTIKVGQVFTPPPTIGEQLIELIEHK
jgi:hypothetical protein